MLMESIGEYEGTRFGWIFKEHVYIELHIVRTANPLENDTESDEDASDTDSDEED